MNVSRFLRCLALFLGVVFLPSHVHPYEFTFKGLPAAVTFSSEADFDAALGQNRDIPRDDESVLNLARKLFRSAERDVSAEAGTAGEHAGCGTYDVSMLMAALQNPALGDATRDEVEALMAASIPLLPRIYRSGHVTIYYTSTDPNANHNISTAQAQSIAALLNSYWSTFRANFREPTNFLGNVDVLVYDLDVGGFAVPILNQIHLDSPSMRDSCWRQVITAHELFHRVQFAYGWLWQANSQWMLEGSATWAMKYVRPAQLQYTGFLSQGLGGPDKNLLALRKYDAVGVWVYLAKRLSWTGVRDAWLNFSRNGGNAKNALSSVTSTRLGLNFDRYIQEWSRVNYLKDFLNAGTYDYPEDELVIWNCGVKRGPLADVRRTRAIASSTPVVFSNGVSPYGSDYYEFSVPGTAGRVTLALVGQATGNFYYAMVGIKDNSYTLLGQAYTPSYTFRRYFSPGAYDRIGLILTGMSIGGTYKLTVNSGPPLLVKPPPGWASEVSAFGARAGLR